MVSAGESSEDLPLPRRAKSRGWRARASRLAQRRLPILRWSREYSREAATADVVAGVTLGLTLVPQSIAYAALADLPLQQGLYSSFVGTMLYVVLGTVKQVSIGPTSLMALMTLQTCHGLTNDYVVLLTFLSGVAVLAMGMLKLGFLVELISPAVTSGFTSATVIIIVVSQIKGLLGLSFVAESVWDNLVLLWQHARTDGIRVGDCLLGLVSCVILLLLRRLKDVQVSEKRAWLKPYLWLASIARNATVVFGAAIFAYVTHDHETGLHPWFKLSGRVEPGLPRISLPPFSAPAPNGNGTLGVTAMAAQLVPGVLLTPVVMLLANIAIAKAFSDGARVDASQEMFTLGLCNIMGSLVRAMPTCGAFTRSAVSNASGVRTPLAGLYSGIITLLALAFMTEYFYFIPRACLSSVLICAVVFMLDISSAQRLWRSDRGELAVLLLTLLLGVVLSVELALAAGATAGLLRLLAALMAPTTDMCARKAACGEVGVVRPSLALTYLSAERLAERVAAAAEAVAPRPVLVDCGRLSLIDDAAAQVLERTIKQLEAAGQQVVLFNAGPAVARRLRKLKGVWPEALAAHAVGAALAAADGDCDAAPLLA